MEALREFAGLDRSFWAHVKLVSETLGYSKRQGPGAESRELRRYNFEEVVSCLRDASLYDGAETSADVLRAVTKYLNTRADLLEQQVAPNLMNLDGARAEFDRLCAEVNPKCYLPMNKQKGEKSHPNYMAAIVNMLTEKALGGRAFDDCPRRLPIVTKDRKLLRTFSRWMDGAYPSMVDPHAIWEVKEYYGTTTFGSRVADGVYETMLDGEECADLLSREGRKVYHYLIVDDRFTWWDCGRSYLCRIIDALHVGLVDEALFGREVLRRWPEIVKMWP